MKPTAHSSVRHTEYSHETHIKALFTTDRIQSQNSQHSPLYNTQNTATKPTAQSSGKHTEYSLKTHSTVLEYSHNTHSTVSCTTHRIH